MTTLQYNDIGHPPATGPVALWWVDHHGNVHEEQRDTKPLPQALFETHLEHHAPDPAPVAFGRVELASSRGTIRLVSREGANIVGRVLDALEDRYPGSVWYVFQHAA
ncbi:MAG: hypothetical protein KF838_15625 [Phycisphaeraceae bacterium]|nr:MAG: hypothetical protein KF838_15625 [Phycisphaeraceae bacterium]